MLRQRARNEEDPKVRFGLIDSSLILGYNLLISRVIELKVDDIGNNFLDVLALIRDACACDMGDQRSVVQNV